MHSSIVIVAGALGTALGAGQYTATVIESSTITVFACGPNVSCTGGQHGSTSTVEVSSAPAPSTTCELSTGTTLITSVILPVVSETSVAIPTTSFPAVSSESPSYAATTPVVPSVAPSSVAPADSSSVVVVPTSVVPSSVASSVGPSTEVLTLSSVTCHGCPSGSVGSSSVATAAPSSEVPGTGPVFTNSTLNVPTLTGSFTTGILTATGSPTVPVTATSTSVVHPSPSKPITGSAPSSSAPAPNNSGRMLVPSLLMGLLAVGVVLFA